MVLLIAILFLIAFVVRFIICRMTVRDLLMKDSLFRELTERGSSFCFPGDMVMDEFNGYLFEERYSERYWVAAILKVFCWLCLIAFVIALLW